MTTTDYEAAVKVARAAIKLKESKRFPFNKEDIFPDAVIPEGIEKGSPEHGLFLFHSISLDSMRQAEQVYKGMRALHKRIGDLAKLSQLPRKELSKILDVYLGHSLEEQEKTINDPLGTLISNAKLFEEKYSGDITQMQGENIQATIRNVSEFIQYAAPKAALLTKNLVRFGIWSLPEYEIPIKIDRHIQRISLGCGVINEEAYAQTITPETVKAEALKTGIEQMISQGHFTQKEFENGEISVIRGDRIVKPLTDVYWKVTSQEKISAIDLDDSLWAIGAYLCKKNDQTTCKLSCGVNCYQRYPSDNWACWFFLGRDKRRNQEQGVLDL